MTHILDLIKEQKSKQRYITQKSEAWDYFKKQKKSIEAISYTNGYKEIREYWARELIACQDRLETMKSTDITGVQEQLKLAKRFFEFLDNLMSADISEAEEVEE